VLTKTFRINLLKKYMVVFFIFLVDK
jgi:hypothetical protein